MFSKILIILDYIVFGILVILSIFVGQYFVDIIIAWTGQLVISSGFYFWKARQENRVKIPFYLLQSLSEEEQNKIDLTQIIMTIIQGD